MLRKWPLILIAVVLILGSCGLGGDGVLGDNPSKEADVVDTVDQTLPTAAKLPAFEGNFVDTKEDAFALAYEPLLIIMQNLSSSDLPALFSIHPALSAARAVETGTIEPVEWNHDTELIPGATLTGFVRGSWTTSFADEGPARGDYVQADYQTQMALDFDNLTEDSSDILIAGKYSFDGSLKGKLVEFTKVDPLTVRIGGTLAVTGGYAFTISDKVNDRGIKVITDIRITGITPQTITIGSLFPQDEEDEDYSVNSDEVVAMLEDIQSPFRQFTIKMEIYDNNNKRRYSETVNANDLFNEVDLDELFSPKDE